MNKRFRCVIAGWPVSYTHLVADGEYDIEDFNFARSDEIGMLADSFNHQMCIRDSRSRRQRNPAFP